MSDTVKTYTVQEATVRMERFCAYQERCHKEVVAKLRQMRMIPEAIDLILTHLIEDNYLNPPISLIPSVRICCMMAAILACPERPGKSTAMVFS